MWGLGESVIELPDGARMRGRGLRHGVVPEPPPEWGLYLLGAAPPETAWPVRHLRCRDFSVPRDAAEARAAFAEAHRLALDGVRVEVACGGGKGRTGLALACIAQLAGVPPEEATAFVRARYDRHAVETPWQRRWVRRFDGRRR